MREESAEVGKKSPGNAMDKKVHSKRGIIQQQALVLIKPDGMIKGLAGYVIAELSDTGLKMVGAKVVTVTKELAEEHYQHLREKAFFKELIHYIMGSLHEKNILALVYQGENCVEQIRNAIGATNPESAHPTSIRGKFGRITTKGVFENVVHASENDREAEREIKLWFRPDELAEAIYPTQTRTVQKKEFFWK